MINMETSMIDSDVATIWNFHIMHCRLVKSDLILVFGSHDEKVAEYAGQLFLRGLAPLMVFTGAKGRISEGLWPESEAEHFASIAESIGVPRQRMLLETIATNAAQNVDFSRKLLSDKGIIPGSIISVSLPYMERRIVAIFQKRWPQPKLSVASPEQDFEKYLTLTGLEREFVINRMVGEVQRIRAYGESGEQANQQIPKVVWQAYERLVTYGFDKQLMRS